MKTVFFTMLIIFTACSGSKILTKGSLNTGLNEQTLKECEHVYVSGANDVAEIILLLKKNKTFALSMMIMPQPLTEDEVESIHTSGKWSQQSNWIKLTFRNRKWDLNALFDMNYADEDQFRLIDEKNVEINDLPGELIIWGIGCERIK